MNELKISVKIDGEEYTLKQLKRYQYQRTLHVLHEMKRLGARIQTEGRELSHEDINWLEPEEAERICLDLRDSLSEEEMLKLFEVPEADAERRWKEYNADYDPAKVHVGVTEVSVQGVTMQEAMAIIGGATDERQAKEAFPEHYIVIGDIGSGQRGMETFGMLGEPVYVKGITTEHPEELPIEPDASYPVKIAGEMALKRDGTPIHVGAYHMFRPSPDGFDVKSSFFCPGKAPKGVADGHKIHFAIEIVNSSIIAYRNRVEAKNA